MTMSTARRLGRSFFLVALIARSVAASAQTAVSVEERARQLYAAAEYEQALAVLGTAAASPQVQQYRALSLVGLGRDREAEATVKALVAESPEFIASEEEMPPRFVALVRRTRRELVPPLLRHLYTDAREYHQAKEYERAQAAFERLLALSSAADLRDIEGMADLRLLADGFVDITKAARAPAPAPPGLVPTPAAASVAPPPRIATPVPATATPAVARRQTIPPWTAATVPVATSVGAVRVRINRHGAVTSATIVKSVSPRYDLRVLDATKSWEYTPAMVNGVAVESDSIVEIRVNAAR